jgi:hypothetical protein
MQIAAQGRGGQAPPPQPPATPRAAAPVDVTGTWVALITEDWRFRMVTPPKGDTASVPLNDGGVKAANSWDPAKDAAAGEQCKAYGAAGVMRLPTRLRISWENDTTLKVETDAGTQTRLFRFNAADPGRASSAPTSPASAPSGEPTWQGYSVAQWETMPEGQGVAAGGGGGGRGRGQGPPLSGSLKVVTTQMRPGYVRRNGVPYSGQAVLTEFFDRTAEPYGDSLLILTSVLDDPTYLNVPFMLTTHYKREPDASKFNPRPCEMTPEVKGPAPAAR